MVNNKKSERNLCQYCAMESGEAGFAYEPKYSIHNLLAGLLNFNQSTSAAMQKTPAGVQFCDNCGMSYTDFSRSGRLGCSLCYTHFAPQLDPLIRRVQGGTQHGGKTPTRTGGTLKLKSQIRQLRHELQKYITREEFEKAAQVRDQIKALEQELGTKGVE
jgi:protein arginine kinase activator